MRIRTQILLSVGLAVVVCTAANAEMRHAFAVRGDPRHANQAEFKHFDWVNADAHRAGQLTFCHLASGAPEILYSVLAPLEVSDDPDRRPGLLVFDTLIARNPDEASSWYGLIASEMDINPDQGMLSFHVDPRARYADGTRITAHSVMQSSEALLAAFGYPLFMEFSAPEIDRLNVKTAPPNLELALSTLSSLPVIESGLASTLTRGMLSQRLVPNDIVPSGAYEIAEHVPGRDLVLRRRTDYWAAEHPTRKGLNNFETITISTYRDASVIPEALITGMCDVSIQRTAFGSLLATKKAPAIEDGRISIERVSQVPGASWELVFNQNVPALGDRKLRLILGGGRGTTPENESNANYESFEVRTLDPYRATELSISESYPSPSEREFLSRFRIDLESGFFTLDGTKRELIRREELDGTQVPERLTLIAPSTFPETALERVVARYLSPHGIDAVIPDRSEYSTRLASKEFDLAIVRQDAGDLSPDVYWMNARFHPRGSKNHSGMNIFGIDNMIEEVVNDRTREGFVMKFKAVSRVWAQEVPAVPLARETEIIGRTSAIQRPPTIPAHGHDLRSWWREP